MPYMLVFMRFICTHTRFECFGINACLVQLLVIRVFFIANLTYLVTCSRCIGSAWISMGYSGLPLFLTLFAHWFAFPGKDGFPTHSIIAASRIRFWLLQVWHRVASGTCSATNFYGPIVTMFLSCSQDAYFLNISSLFYLFDDSSLSGFLFSMYSDWFPDGVCLAHVFDRWCQGRFSDGSSFKSRSPPFLVHGIPCFLTISFSDHLCFDAFGDKNVYLCFVLLSPDRWHEKFAASFPLLSFDSTRGYPGEGPNWICKSANIDSMNSHPDIFLWNADFILARETRITQNNFNSLQQDSQQQGKQIFPRAFLHEKTRLKRTS